MSEVDRVRTQLALSVIAGLLILVITVLGYQDVVDVTDADRALLAICLSTSYILGISMALRPNWRSRFSRARQAQGGSLADDGPLPGPPRKGHHPDCDGFAGHTLTWGSRTRCAGCTGLAMGAVAAILLSAAYALEPPAVLWTYGPGLVIAGIALVALDMFAANAGGLDPRAGLGLNALMMIGFALVCVGLLESTGEVTWGLVGVVVSALWMDSRIQVSRLNHAAICVACEGECVAYSL